jgi:chromosomal replication initiator protein
MQLNAQEAWNAAYAQLELQLDRPTFEMWVRGASLLSMEGDTFVIGVRSAIARDMLAQRLYRNVRRLVCDFYGGPAELRFEVRKSPQKVDARASETEMPLFRLLAQEQATSAPAPLSPDPSAAVTDDVPLHQRIARPPARQLPETVLNEGYTFSRFLPGQSNQMVYAAAQAVAENPAAVYNPLFLHGSVGLGKTHLLQAIAHECRSRGLRTVYVPAEAFTNDLVESIRSKSTAMFRDRYRHADVLLIDDIQFLKDKESTQEEFFHTFNVLHQFNKQIVIASDERPANLTHLESRLRSRFEGGLVMDVRLPELETRIAILQMWAHEIGMRLDTSVAEYVASRVQRHLRELQGVFKKMVIQARMSRSPLTIDHAAEEIDGLQRPRYAITLQQVIDVTAAHHGLTADDLTGPRRTAEINQARQIAMALCRELTNASLPQIGDAFGGRKHSTVLHACQKAATDAACDPVIASVVADVRGQLLRR